MIERALITALACVAVLMAVSVTGKALYNTFTELSCELNSAQVCVKEDLN